MMMNIGRRLLLIIALFVMAVTLYPAGHHAAAGDLKGTVMIGGTGGAMGSMKELALAYQKKHPGVSVVFIQNLGTRGGIKAVSDGAIDIGLAGRPLSTAEIAAGIKGTVYAISPFLFVTSNAAGMDLTFELLRRIYAGEIRKWPDGKQIRIILRPEGDVDSVKLKEMSPEMEKALKQARSREGMTVALTDQDGADMIEKLSGSFGTTTLTQIISEKRRLTVLRLNGKVPSLRTLADGTYPYCKRFTMVTGSKPSPAARGFIEFVRSNEGRSILLKTGNNVPNAEQVTL